MSANAAPRLIQHYVDNCRRLPWREPPGSAARPDPYRVWLSEVMLQQTTVATVIPRFERFVARWPSVEALAAARDEDILSEWAGLGYYARARNLIACARLLASRGFPSTEAEWRKLPGVGAYTAAAIAAIAFGERTAVVDTNVTRVISRLHGLKVADPDQVRGLVDALTPADRPGDFAQAMMDLGATVCRPRRPDCPACPLRAGCTACASGEPERYPEPKARKSRPVRYGTAYWTERNGHVWLVRRPANGLLGGMTALPSGEWSAEPHGAANPVTRVRHVFTHFALELDVLASPSPQGEGWWHPVERLSEAGLPTLFAKAADAALAKARRLAA